MKRIILLLSIWLISHAGYAQTTGKITGTVIDAAGAPVKFATVRINKTDKTVSSTTDGTFSFPDLVPGTYTLKISAVGFEQKDETIRLNQNETKEVKISLAIAENMFLNEVVVTTRKREKLKEEFTSAVTIVNAKSIEDLQTVNNNVSDILSATVPGLGVSSGTSSNWGQSLRGRQVLILIDGVPQSTPLRNGSVDMRTIDANVLERIEVIKGATSLYGNGAAGGMINYITKDNSNLPGKLASKTEIASTGSVLNTKGTLGGRLSQSFYGRTGKLDYTASGSYEQTGQVKDSEGDILGPTYGLSNNKIYNAFGKLGYQFNENQRLQLSYNFFRSLEKNNLREVMGSMKEGRKTLAVEGTTPGSDPGTRWNHNALLKYTHNDLFAGTGLNVSGYMQDFSTVFFYSTRFENGGQSTIHSAKKGLRIDLETPFQAGNSLRGDVTYGIDLLNDKTSQPLLDGRNWVPEMNMANTGPFVQLQATVFNDFVFNGGLRYEDIHIGVEDYMTLKPYNNNTGGFGSSINVKGGDLNYNNLVFNSGLRYNRFDFFKPYVNFSQGFSVADVGLVLRAATVNDISKIQTEAVIVDNYEAGFASEFKSFRVEASAYISKSKLGSSFVDVNGFYVIARQPERVYGFELSADAYATKDLMFGATYTYVEGKRDGNANGEFNDVQDTYLGGERITPPKYTAYMKYTSPSKKFNVRSDLIISGARNRFSPNASGVYKTYEGKVGAYEIINLSSSYKLSNLTTLKFGIENLLNTDYFPARSLWPSIDQYYVKGRGTNFTLGLAVDIK